jgi:glyoxylate/hydroxypyruvate reductase A
MKPPIPFVAQTDAEETQAWVAALARAMPSETIVPLPAMRESDAALAEVAIVANPNPADLLQLPHLKWVHSVWAGVERLVADLGASPLAIVRLTDPQLAATMAEAVLAWTLYLHRDMPAYARQQAQHVWQPRPYVRPQKKTVGLLGLGKLGEAAAHTLLAAGFQVCGWSRSPKQIDQIHTYSGDDGLRELLGRTDILVCLLPLTGETRGLLNSERLGLLPAGAALINFARGPIVPTSALLVALDSRQLSHAVLDVFDEEPLPADSPLWAHPNITVLPHISAPTDLETASAIVAGNIERYRQFGEIPPRVDLGQGY